MVADFSQPGVPGDRRAVMVPELIARSHADEDADRRDCYVSRLHGTPSRSSAHSPRTERPGPSPRARPAARAEVARRVGKQSIDLGVRTMSRQRFAATK